VVVIGDEPRPPYQRPPLSKDYLRGDRPVEDLVVRADGWWADHDVEILAGLRARAIDPRERIVTLADGRAIAYDRALVATGVRNRRLEVPGADIPGVHQLRTIDDADAIRAAAATARAAVVVGMGFIGAEVAASLRMIGLAVTVVVIFETALFRVVGAVLGRAVEAIHRDHGVRMLFGETVERFEGAGALERVVTRGGRSIDCDLAVVGIGTEPNDGLLGGDGGGIAVRADLATAAPDVFAAGDVATHDHPLFGPIRVEHFDNAIKMGEHAAGAMLGSAEPFDDPHWFWSDQYEHQIQMSGVVTTERMVVRGSIEDRSFGAFFLDRGDRIRACVSLDRPHDVRRSLRLIRSRVVCDPGALADPEVDLRTLMPQDGGVRRA
jgi:3-phenylpropionate/trans-cinnamate dioxygenase ferredoxin reductase subunit